MLVGIGCGLVAGLINGLAHRLHEDSALHRHARHDGFGARPVALVVERQPDLVSDGKLRRHLDRFPRLAHLGLLPWKGINPVLIFISLAVLFHLILTYTKYGKHCYAIGSNEEAARMSGINVDRHKVLVYVIAGILAAIAALVL